MPVHIYFLLYQLRSPESNNSVVATNTPSAQILASNTVLQQKLPGFHGEMADSRTEAVYMRDESGTSWGTRK